MTMHGSKARDDCVWHKCARQICLAQRRATIVHCSKARDDNAWLAGATDMYACLKGARRLGMAQALAMIGHCLERLNDGA